jgi:hypothetical protein
MAARIMIQPLRGGREDEVLRAIDDVHVGLPVPLLWGQYSRHRKLFVLEDDQIVVPARSLRSLNLPRAAG